MKAIKEFIDNHTVNELFLLGIGAGIILGFIVVLVTIFHY